MDASNFDDLAKRLAATASRKEALRLLGGTLAAGALAALLPGRAWADNSDCAHFCNSVFPPGPDRGQCKSDAAHGKGLCYTCGPASSGGTQSICCSQNPNGTCSSYSSAICCGSSATCLNGSCCPTANVCGSTCCTSPNTCGGGGTPGVCGSCGALLQPCTSAAQCCSTDHTTCAFNNVVIGQNVCCSTLGGACTTGGPSGDCCVVNTPGGQDYAYCSPNATCGGPGAACRFNEACVSGQCSNGVCN